MSEAWRIQWHKVPKYLPSANRPLFPRGDRVSVRNFEDMLFNLKGRFFNALDSVRAAGINEKVRLGQLPLSEVKDLATYLYDNSIHPELLTKTLELIAANADRLLEARIRQLGRYSLAQAHKKNDIDLFTDIGRKFELFGIRSGSEQLHILEKMGVIVLKTAPPVVEPPTLSTPRFSLGEKLIGKVGLTKFPQTFFAFERTSIEATTLNERELQRSLELFFEPENLALAESTARTLKEMGGTELRLKFHRTQEGVVAEFKAKGIGQFLDSASILLIPKGAQQRLC